MRDGGVLIECANQDKFHKIKQLANNKLYIVYVVVVLFEFRYSWFQLYSVCQNSGFNLINKI